MLQQLMGGQARPEYDDFVQRYDRGAPWDGITDQEALQRYQQVAPHLPPDLYEESARDSFDRLTPAQRLEFGRWLRQEARQRGASSPDFDGDGVDDRMQDPRELARVTTRLRQQQPGLLDGLLGGAVGGGFTSGAIGKGALAGIAAMAMQRMMRR